MWFWYADPPSLPPSPPVSPDAPFTRDRPSDCHHRDKVSEYAAVMLPHSLQLPRQPVDLMLTASLRTQCMSGVRLN